MKERHIEFLIRFHKPTSRQLNLLSDGGVRQTELTFQSGIPRLF